jgi:Zn-dependent metalloprotease
MVNTRHSRIAPRARPTSGRFSLPSAVLLVALVGCQGKVGVENRADTVCNPCGAGGSCAVGTVCDPTVGCCVPCPGGRCLYSACAAPADLGTPAPGSANDLGASGGGLCAPPGLPDVVEADVDPSGRVRRIIIDSNANVPAAEFQKRYGAFFGLSASDTLVSTPGPVGVNGFHHQFLTELHETVPVDGAEVVLTTLPDAVSGERLEAAIVDLPGAVNVATTPKIPSGRAEELAIHALAQKLGGKGKPKLIEPTPKLIILGGILVWRIVMTFQDLRSEYVAIVDAMSGVVLWVDSTAFGATYQDTSATGTDYSGSTRQFTAGADTTNPSHLILWSQADSAHTQYYDVPSGQSLEVETQNGNFVSLPAPGKFGVFVSAHEGITSTLHFLAATQQTDFTNWYPSNGIYQVNAFGSEGASLQYQPISGQPGSIKFGADGNPPGPFTTDKICLDGVAHETAHALAFQKFGSLTSFPNNGCGAPNQLNESCALYEAFGDIIGEATEQYARGAVDWIDCEDFLSTGQARSLKSPKDLVVTPNWIGQTGTFDLHGANAIDSSDKNWTDGNQYSRSGPASRWFYLITQGAQPPDVPIKIDAIGIASAAKVAWDTFTAHAWPGTYGTARIASQQAVEERCGIDSAMEASVVNAWFDVGNGGTFTPLLTFSPADDPQGANPVAPWPAHLQWNINPPKEQAWKVQIDTVPVLDPNDADFRELPGVADGTQGAHVDVNLRADTVYYWRVIPNLPNQPTVFDLSCARQTHVLKTQKQSPQMMSPQTTGAPGVNPWGLSFIWQQPKGAIGAHWSLYDANRSYTMHTDLSEAADCPGDACTVQRSVAIASSITWTVKPQGPTTLLPDGTGNGYSPNDGEAVTVQSVQTDTPAAVFTSPDNGDGVNPWEVALQWKPTPGAAQYDLDVHNVGGPTQPTWQIPGNRTSTVAQTVARFDEDSIHISVTLTPVGPVITTDAGQFQDNGTGDSRDLLNRGSQTIPCIDYPFNTCLGISNFADVDYGSTNNLGFEGVTGADGYLVTLYPIGHRPSDPAYVNTVNFNAANTFALLGNSATIQQLTPNWTSPWFGAGQAGYWVSVQACILGLATLPYGSQCSPVKHTNGASPYIDPSYAQKGEGPLYVQVPPVQFFNTENDLNFVPNIVNGHAIADIVWGADPVIYAPDHVEFTWYNGQECGVGGNPAVHTDSFTSSFSSNRFHSDVDLGSSNGSNVWGQYFSFQVSEISNVQGVTSSSTCRSIHIAAPRCGDGVINQSSEQCDDGPLNGSTQSPCSSNCTLNGLKCGQPVASTGGYEEYTKTISLGGPNARGYLWYNTLTIPDQIVVTSTKDGTQLFDSGCIGTCGGMMSCGPSTWAVSPELVGDSSPEGNVTITVHGGCGNPLNMSTEWIFYVECTASGLATIPAPAE